MRVLAGLFVMSLIVTVLVLAALVQLAIALLPYLAVALIVVLVSRWRPRDTATRAAAAPPMRTCPGPQAWVRTAQPRYRVGAPAAAPEGWVMVPVWVAPTRPDPRVIDAEVIVDRD